MLAILGCIIIVYLAGVAYMGGRAIQSLIRHHGGLDVYDALTFLWIGLDVGLRWPMLINGAFWQSYRIRKSLWEGADINDAGDPTELFRIIAFLDNGKPALLGSDPDIAELLISVYDIESGNIKYGFKRLSATTADTLVLDAVWVERDRFYKRFEEYAPHAAGMYMPYFDYADATE